MNKNTLLSLKTKSAVIFTYLSKIDENKAKTMENVDKINTNRFNVHKNLNHNNLL